jgi:Putative oxidoreductase C terminal domain
LKPSKIDPDSFSEIQQKYPGVELKEGHSVWQVVVPESYNVGHEAHFAQVTEKFIEYFKKGNMPDFEVPNMLAKYYTTTQALKIALGESR